MTYRGGDVVWAMYHHHGRCCSINLLAIHFRSGVWAFGTYGVPVLFVFLLVAFAMSYLLVAWKTKTLWHTVYIYICCCYAAAKLERFCGCVALCCWYAVVVLLFLVCCCCCCCYVAVTYLACRCNVACCVVALLLCCCCFSLKVFRLLFLQWLELGFLVNSFKFEIRLSFRGAQFC